MLCSNEMISETDWDSLKNECVEISLNKGNKHSFLLIEDNERDARLTRDYLQELGADVRLAQSGSEAEKLYGKAHYDAVILKQSLLDMTGIEIYRRLREQGPIPVCILVTLNGNQQAIAEALKEGIHDIILKSANMSHLEVLSIVLSRALEQSRQKEVRNEMEKELLKKALQLRKLNFDLRNLNAQLQKASRLKSEFLANVSHELRSPMNAICGYSTLLLRGNAKSAKEQRELLERIIQITMDFTFLVDSLLDLSKIEAKQMQVSRAPVDLKWLVMEVVSRFAPLAAEKGLVLKKVIGP